MEPKSKAAIGLLGENSGGKATNARDGVRGKLIVQKWENRLLLAWRICLWGSLIFYVAMFIIGIWGNKKCKVNDNIPFFLIITGAIGLISKALSLSRKLIFKDYHFKVLEPSSYTIEFVFLLLGSYWVFKAYRPNFNDETDSNYCNKTVYMFAFIYLTTACVIIIGAMLLSCCCVLCIICCIKDDDDAESQSRPMRKSNSETSPKC